jgi:hypothetical protein
MDHALQKALAHVQSQIAAKTRARDTLNAELAQLQATAIGLQNALGQQIRAEIAWTNLVRTVIYSNPNRTMTAVEVRDTLQNWGYNFAGIENPLALVNTCLQRLAEQGEIIRSETGRPFRFRCDE